MAVQTRKLGDSYWCPKCRTYKPREAFHKNKNEAFGVDSYCRGCAAALRRIHQSPEHAFWKRFWARTTPVGKCLQWNGEYTNKQPTCCWRGRRGISLRRVVYSLSRADIPSDMFVDMTCKNPKCVLQSHMRLITRQQVEIKRINSVSSLARGDRHVARLHPERLARGENNGSAKLTATDIVAIRQKRAQGGASLKSIAREYGVSESNVKLILQRKTWAHIPDSEEPSDA